MSLLKMLQYSFSFAASLHDFSLCWRKELPWSWPLLCTFQIEPTTRKDAQTAAPTACHEQRWVRALCDDLSFRSMLLHRCLTKNERVIRKVCAKTMQIRCSLWRPNKRYVLYILYRNDASKVIAVFQENWKIVLYSCCLNLMHWLYY